jgi:hypothetical protein
VLVCYQPAAGRDRRRQARLGLVVRHPDVDVDPVALRARRVGGGGTRAVRDCPSGATG